LYVLPASSEEKACFLSDWKNKATVDHNEIEQMINATGNLAILTGKKSGIFVLDIDIKNGKNGLKSIQEKIEGFNIEQYLDKTMVVKTMSGGYHLYFKWDDNYPIKSIADILEGVDTRGEGRIIIAPPSKYMLDGELKHYQVISSTEVIGEAPKELLEIITQSSEYSGQTWALVLPQREHPVYPLIMH
jgi:hypothetical protein